MKSKVRCRARQSSTTPRLLAKCAERRPTTPISSSRISPASCSSSASERPFRSAGDSIRRATSCCSSAVPFQKIQGQARSRSPRAPRGSSAATASSASCLARRRLPSTPRKPGYVHLPSSESLPTRLPSLASSPWTSSRSSTIWNARPDRLAVTSSASTLGSAAAGDDGPHPQRGAEQGPGLAAVDRLERASARAVASAPRPGGRPSGRRPSPTGPAASARTRTQPSAASAGRTCARHHLEGQRQQAVAGQDRRRLVERLVAGRPAPPQVVVVHRRQVVVDQRIGVHHLQRAGRRQRRLRRRPRTPRPPSGRAPAGAACRPPARCNASPPPAAPGTPPPGPLSTSGRYAASASSTRRRARSRYSASPDSSVVRVENSSWSPSSSS